MINGNLRVRDIQHLLDYNALVADEGEKMSSLLRKAALGAGGQHAYIVDCAGVLSGVVRPEILFGYALAQAREESAAGPRGPVRPEHAEQSVDHRAADIMLHEPVYVRPETSLRELSGLFMQERADELPVLDDERCLIGVIRAHDVLRAMQDEQGGEHDCFSALSGRPPYLREREEASPAN